MQADKNTSIFLKSYDRSKWKKVRLGDVGNFVSGSGFPLRFQGIRNDELPFLKVSDFSLCKNTNTFNMANNYISKEVAGILNCSIIPAGSIIFAKIGAAISLERKRINKIPVCIDNNMMAFIPTEVSNDFICHLFQTIKLSSYISATALPSLSSKELKNIAILLPPENEQKEISAGIDSVNTHIANLEKQISKYENIKKLTINLLLKPKADWIKKTIGDVCSFFTSSSKSAYIDPDGQYFIVDMGAVSDDGTLIAQKRTNYAHDFLHKNDLIMPKDDIGGGNIIGKAVAIQENDKYILSDHVYKLQTELDATFLSYLINSPKINKYMRAMATGSAQLGISKRTVSKCELCFPADLGQQKAIAQKLGAIDEHISNLKLQLKKQQDLKQGLMQYFFGD